MAITINEKGRRVLSAPKPTTPTSVSNPTSLNPKTQNSQVNFSDNIAKPDL